MEQVLDRLNFRPSAMLFLGDGLRDWYRLTEQERCRDIPAYAVAGNCDASLVFPPDDPEVRTVILEGRRIVMMHGQTHDVRYRPDRAVRYAAEQGADVLLYGHTHIPYERMLTAGAVIKGDGEFVLEKPLLVANPGSIGSPRDGSAHSFGVLTIKGGTVLFSHGSFEG